MYKTLKDSWVALQIAQYLVSGGNKAIVCSFRDVQVIISADIIDI